MSKLAHLSAEEQEADRRRRRALGAGPSDWIPNVGPQEAFLACPAFEVLYGGAAGGGKLLSLDTPIATPSGWTTMGEVRDGDLVFAVDGAPSRVLSVSAISYGKQAYEVVFSDGSVIVADAGHLWETTSKGERDKSKRRTPEARAARRAARAAEQDARRAKRRAAPGKHGGSGKGPRPDLAAKNAERAAEREARGDLLAGAVAEIRTTEDILATLRLRNGAANHSVRCCLPLQLPEAKLPIDPYMLGIWLGDGHSASAGVTTADEEIVHALRAGWPDVVKRASTAGGKASTYYLRGGFQTTLRLAGLIGNKHVPVAYLRASFEQRLALLQGLMDTDGTCGQRGDPSFTTTSPALRNGTLELIHSLGIKAVACEGLAKLNGRVIGPKWTIKFVTELPVFRLKRKLDRQKRDGFRGCHARRFIVDIRPLGPVPMRCISIDHPTHLYLAGRQMIPTHNSIALLVDAMRDVDKSHYRAVLFRREYPQLARTLLLFSKEIYPHVGGRWFAGAKTWVFPSGARIELASIPHEKDVERYQGTEYGFAGFDELTHFTFYQYTYMISRLRSTQGIKPRIRAASNPGSVGHEWVMKRFAPWLYTEEAEDYHGPRVPAGTIMYFRKIERGGEDIDVPCRRDAEGARSRAFFPSKISDTPQLKGTDYEKNLDALDRVTRRRLKGGDWMARDAAGEFFERGWFLDPNTNPPRLATEAPITVLARVRYWDLASTPDSRAKPSSAWTAGVLLSKTDDGIVWIEDIVRGQWSPGRVEAQILATAESDPPGTRVMIEHDPGQAGDAQAVRFAKLLVGFDFGIVRPQGDKLARARPVSASAEVHNIRVVKGAWNNAFFVEAESFPEATKDQIDALSGASGFLAKIQRSPFGRHGAKQKPQGLGGFA